jgi:hypothetical protein
VQYPRIAQHVIEIQSAHRNFGARQIRSHFGRDAAQLRIEPLAGFPRRRNLSAEAPLGTVAAHIAQLADLALQVGDDLPIRQPAIVQPFRERGQLALGASSTRFALTRPAKSSTYSTFSRASGASLIVRPSPWRLEAPLTAQLRLSKAEADPTCEHQRNRAGEAVLVLEMNLWAGGHLLRNSISDTLCGERIDRLQTRVGLGRERESKCLQMKTHLGGVRF